MILFLLVFMTPYACMYHVETLFCVFGLELNIKIFGFICLAFMTFEYSKQKAIIAAAET